MAASDILIFVMPRARFQLNPPYPMSTPPRILTAISAIVARVFFPSVQSVLQGSALYVFRSGKGRAVRREMIAFPAVCPVCGPAEVSSDFIRRAAFAPTATAGWR